MQRIIKSLRIIWRAFMLAIAICFLLLPAGSLMHYLRDPLIGQPGVSHFARDLFSNLTPNYEAWARARVSSARAAELSTQDIEGTEWPVFGSIFYLWSVEALQKSWAEDNALFPFAPANYAQGAIEAATALVLDEGHAGWVKKHWGDTYLTKENVFYRALRVAAMTSHCNLTGSVAYRPQLERETEALAKEIDASPTGLLEDYPGQCYPSDVIMAWNCISRSNRATGQDHAALIQRGLRAFTGPALDAHGLVPYSAYSRNGQPIEPGRGCGNSYVGFCAPALWPGEAKEWYRLYEKHYWDEPHGIAGFREFARDGHDGWYFDVDSGPVIAGLGTAASAFGIAAARINGRFDHAKPLTAELLVAAWPLPDGTLLVPRLLSNAADAPYLGEAAILFALTCQPEKGFPVVQDDKMPWFAYGIWFLYLLFGTWLVLVVIYRSKPKAAPSKANQNPE